MTLPNRWFRLLALLPFLLAPAQAAGQEGSPPPSERPRPIVTGLSNPRGVAWDDLGRLHVALAGRGGETSSIVRVEGRCLVPVVRNAPSIGVYNSYAGIADLAFRDGRLYALSAAIGAPNGLYRIDDDALTLVADLGSWLESHPPRSRPRDYTPAGILHAMTPVPGEEAFWVVESNHGRLLRVNLEGSVEEVADLSAEHPVPVGVASAPDGSVYLAYLGVEPYLDGGARVVRVDPSGGVYDAWTGLTALADIAIAADGRLYALEMATGNQDGDFLRPGTGRLVARVPSGGTAVLADGLDRPVSLTFGPDGAAYVAGPAFGADDGQGAVLRVGGGTDAPEEAAVDCD